MIKMLLVIKILYVFFFFSLVIIFHELGHYIAFRIFLKDKKPKLIFTWYGILIGENLKYSLKLKQLLFIDISGILFGLPFVIYDTYLTLIYFLLCSIDIVTIFSLIDLLKTYGNVTYYEAIKNHFLKISQEYKVNEKEKIN